jgi:hypothetical protein
VAPDALTRAIEGLVAKEEASLYEAGHAAIVEGEAEGWTFAEDRWQRRISTVRKI